MHEAGASPQQRLKSVLWRFYPIVKVVVLRIPTTRLYPPGSLDHHGPPGIEAGGSPHYRRVTRPDRPHSPAVPDRLRCQKAAERVVSGRAIGTCGQPSKSALAARMPAEQIIYRDARWSHRVTEVVQLPVVVTRLHALRADDDNLPRTR